MIQSHPALNATFGDSKLFERYKRVRQDLHDDLLPLKAKERVDQTHGLEISGYLRKGEDEKDIIRVLVSGLYLNPVEDALLIIRKFFISKFPEATLIELRVRGETDPHLLSYKK